MNEVDDNIKRIKSYPGTDALIGAAAAAGDPQQIVIISVTGIDPRRPAESKNIHIQVYQETGEFTDIITGMGDPHGTRVELNPADLHQDNRAQLIENLYQQNLIADENIPEYEELSDQDLCRKATAKFKKAYENNDYNSSLILIEDIRAAAKANKKGYAHLVLGDSGNLYLDSDLDALKYFIAKNYVSHGAVLFGDAQVEKFLREKGKGMLREFKSQDIKNKILAVMEKFINDNEKNYPVAAKVVKAANQDKGRQA